MYIVSPATASDDLVQELRETLRQYEDTFQSQSSRINALSSENESLKESCETLQDRVECDSVDIAALKLRVERLADSKSTQAARLEELGDELGRSRKQLMQREAELTDFHESAREVLEGQIADLKKRCAMLEQEVKEGQHKLEDKVINTCITQNCSGNRFCLLSLGGGHC